MRMPLFLSSATGLMLLAGGCDSSPGPVSPISPTAIVVPTPASPPKRIADVEVRPKSWDYDEDLWAQQEVTLEFQVFDQDSRKPIESASVEIVYAYQPEFNVIQPNRADGGIRRLVYQGRYVRCEELPPESYFLAGRWLKITAPGYEPIQVSLRKFVGQQRAIDKVPWVKSAPLVVALRKGQPKTPQLGFIAGRYHGGFVLRIYGDDSFSVCLQHAHGCNPSGYGFAEIVDGKLKLRYEERGTSEGDPRMAPILARINSLIREHFAESAEGGTGPT